MATDLISDQELRDLLEKDILELIGAQNLPQEKKEELYKTMADTVQNRTIARLHDQLSEEDSKEFDRLIDEGDNQKVTQFLESKGIDITSLLVEEATIFKTEMVELFKQAKKGENGS